MEFSYKQSRSNDSSWSQYSFNNALKEKVGLLIFDGDALKGARIVFNTRNLTKSFVKTNVIFSKFDASKGKSIVGVGPSPFIKPCLLSSEYMPTSFVCGSNQSRGPKIRVGSSSAEPKTLDVKMNLLPLTNCIKHGTTGFMPLDYVRKLPEYTCTTHKYPVFKVVHSFEDCILEFPHTQPITDSRQHPQDVTKKKCFQCHRKLSKRKNIYMYRDNLFCCPECRYKASVTHYWYKKMMKAMEKNIEHSPISSMNGNTIFSIDCS